MKTIPLTQGKVALIDNEDYKLVSKYHWVTLHARDNLYYAYALIKRNGNYTTLRMHRLIMNAPRDLHIDHRNGNGLDNRKRNLRFATQSQNMQNAKPYKNGTSKFKGVSWTKDMKKWRSAIWYPNKPIILGYFKSEIQAASAYNKAAKKLFGDFARLNEI